MPTQTVARDAATLSACKSSELKLANVRRTALGLLLGQRLAGCAAAAPLTGADPADPQARSQASATAQCLRPMWAFARPRRRAGRSRTGARPPHRRTSNRRPKCRLSLERDVALSRQGGRPNGGGADGVKGTKGMTGTKRRRA